MNEFTVNIKKDDTAHTNLDAITQLVYNFVPHKNIDLVQDTSDI